MDHVQALVQLIIDHHHAICEEPLQLLRLRIEENLSCLLMIAIQLCSQNGFLWYCPHRRGLVGELQI